MSQELLTGTGSPTVTATTVTMPAAMTTTAVALNAPVATDTPEAATTESGAATQATATPAAVALAPAVTPTPVPAPSTPFSRELLFTPATPEHSDIRQTPQNLAFEKAVSHGGQATIFKAHTPSGTPIAVKVFENDEESLLEWRSLKRFSNFRVLPNALAHGTVCMPHAVGAQEKRRLR